MKIVLGAMLYLAIVFVEDEDLPNSADTQM